jgi:flagellar motor protein MotB
LQKAKADQKKIKNMKNFIKTTLRKFLNENYDLVSQFKGDHHGNPMEKNKYLNALGLDEDGIKTIEVWINTMRSDEYWFTQKYPNGASYVDLISDISKKINDLPSFVMKYKSVNPIKVVNFLKASDAIRESDLTLLGRRVILTEQALNDTLLNESWKDVLLGIALLTGVGLNQSQAQTAKKALSNDDVKSKIEATLQDTTTLNKITKNLSPEIKEKITKNADKALNDLESKRGRVTSTVKAKDDKQLTSRLKQGYALTDVDTKSDTIQGKDTVITYTESLDFSIKSDGMFVTGGYDLSPEGIKSIQAIKDSIEQVGGQIESITIEASTDKEPIKMGNQKLAELRTESISKYFSDVDSIDVDIKPDQGPNIYTKTMSKSERDSARKETAEYRYVKITINATYQDTISNTVEPEMKVIEKNTYTLVKTINKKTGGNVKIKRKGPPRIKHRRKCKKNKGVDKCETFGQKKIENFLNFDHQ